MLCESMVDQPFVKDWEKCTNNKERFLVLIRHHMKSSFTQNMRSMMEELGLLEEDCDDADNALKKLLEKNKYEQQYRYPHWEAMLSHAVNTMSLMVGIR